MLNSLKTFQSTRPRRARLYNQINNPVAIPVSIHAPTQGATFQFPAFQRPVHRFNPRAHAGRDKTARSLLSSVSRFNPRAHAGRDQRKTVKSLQRTRFQSTRPRRARLIGQMCFPLEYLVSIHAPTQGATFSVLTQLKDITVSIHAPTQGATTVFR